MVAPAMNTNMWTHPFTDKHIAILRDTYNVTMIDPISKKLACGDTGVGAMAEPQDIAAQVHKLLLDLPPSSLEE